MRYSDLVKAVQRQARERLSYDMLDMILRACFIVIIRALEEGEEVYVPGFGHFEIGTASARTVVSNLDGPTRYQVPGRKRVSFHPSPSWLDELNGEGR